MQCTYVALRFEPDIIVDQYLVGNVHPIAARTDLVDVGMRIDKPHDLAAIFYFFDSHEDTAQIALVCFRTKTRPDYYRARRNCGFTDSLFRSDGSLGRSGPAKRKNSFFYGVCFFN